MTTDSLVFKNLETALNQFGDQFISLYRQNLLQTNSDSSGTLGNTLKFIVSKDVVEYSLDINIQDYWKYVEEGRKAGRFPRVDAIKRWIQIKPILPRPINGKLPTTNTLAYLIGRKIARKGTIGKKIMEKTIDALDVKNILENAVVLDLEHQVDQIFIESE